METGARLRLKSSNLKDEALPTHSSKHFLPDTRSGRCPPRPIFNCDGKRRGVIKELVVTNYNPGRCRSRFLPEPVVKKMTG